VKLQFSESQVSEAYKGHYRRTEICWTNYPGSEATRDYCRNPRSLICGFLPVIWSFILNQTTITGSI